MKKLLAVLAVATLMVGCSSTTAQTKTGLGTIISTKGKDATADKAGSAEANVTVAAVTIDKDGKIVDVKIDVAQVQEGFTAAGVFEDAKVKETKKELGANYEMKKVSTIGKEWDEQVAAFEEFLVGKTLADVQAIEVKDDKTAGDADLATSVSIKINEYKEVVIKAIEDAQK